MFQYLTSRPALAATTSVAALILGVAVILPVADLRIGKPTVVVEEAPIAKKIVPPVEPVRTAPGTVEAPSPAKDDAAALGGATSSVAETSPTDTPQADAALTSEMVAPEPEAVVVDELQRSDTGNAVVAQDLSQTEAEAPMELTEEAVPASPALDGLMMDAEPRLRAEAKVEGDTMAYLPAPASSAPDAVAALVENTEAYATEAPNPVKVTAEEPVSTFSIDVDTASYAVVRSSLTGG